MIRPGGRVFEIPGCRSLLLTDAVENLGDFYRIGEEVAVYEDFDDMIDKMRYYLAHDEERERIAQAGYERTLRDHTWRARLDDIFAATGLAG